MNSPATSEADEAFDFDVPAIVRNLRLLREESLAARKRVGRAPKAPSRKTLALIVEELSAALFPN